MIAVGHVTLNRVRDDRFPDNACDVIYEGPETESWKTRKDPNLPEEKRLYYPYLKKPADICNMLRKTQSTARKS